MSDQEKEVVIFDGPESGMIYQFDGDREMVVFEPSYEHKRFVLNFKKKADLEEIRAAIKSCEEQYLEEVSE